MSTVGWIVRCWNGHPMLRMRRDLARGDLVMRGDVEPIASSRMIVVPGSDRAHAVCGQCGEGPDWSRVSPPQPSAEEQEVLDRETFMRNTRMRDGRTVWEAYESWRAIIAADERPNFRCAACGLHLKQVGGLKRTPPSDVWLCERCSAGGNHRDL